MNNLEAVEAAIEDSGLPRADRYAPLLQLLRVLAAQMDAAGDDPSTRLTAAYLSALKDLARAISTTPKPAAVNRLAEMRSLRNIAPPAKKRRTP